MSIAGAINDVLTAAAATFPTPPKTVVRPGEPDTVAVPTIAYWYTGTGTWGSNTFSQTQETTDWHIRICLPAGPRYVPADGAMDAWLEDAVDAIRAGFFAHVALGGAATGGGLELTDAKAGWLPIGGQFQRIVDMDLHAYLAAVHPIAS